MKAAFRRFAERIDKLSATPWAFLGALAIVLAWLAVGPVFGFSPQWQLVINSVTTIATFLMVFIIQNTQDRDFKSLQLKLDALILASGVGRGLLSLEELDDEELARLQKTFRRLRGTADIRDVARSLERKVAGPSLRT